jgi:hypothetical protein
MVASSITSRQLRLIAFVVGDQFHLIQVFCPDFARDTLLEKQHFENYRYHCTNGKIQFVDCDFASTLL